LAVPYEQPKEIIVKKLAVVFILAAVLATGTLFADHPKGWGVGVQGGFNSDWGGGFIGGAAVSLKVPSLPIYWAARLDITENYFGLGVSGDYYFIDSILVPSIKLHWYLGGGVGLGISFGEKSMGLGIAARLPIGLSWQPFPFLEVFLQAVPSLGVSILPEFHFPYGGFGGDIGIRVWF
jgi:hypothetical protein